MNGFLLVNKCTVKEVIYTNNETKISYLNMTHLQFRGVKVMVIYTRDIMVSCMR